MYLLYDGELLMFYNHVRLLGTPNEEQWPGVTSLRDWHVYPRWEAQNLARAVPSLGSAGVDLLSVSTSHKFLPRNFGFSWLY